jgi:hypothetical protein
MDETDETMETTESRHAEQDFKSLDFTQKG